MKTKFNFDRIDIKLQSDGFRVTFFFDNNEVGYRETDFAVKSGDVISLARLNGLVELISAKNKNRREVVLQGK